MGEEEMKENDGEDEFHSDICKNFGKCHKISPVQQYLKRKKLAFIQLIFLKNLKGTVNNYNLNLQKNPTTHKS
jgi:hypothetical protein